MTTAVVALALLEAPTIGAADPVLTFVEVQKNGVGGVDGFRGASSVSVSPDGKYLYVADEFDNAITVFSRNSTTGAINFVEVQRKTAGGVGGLANVRSTTISPDGNYLYAAGYGDDALEGV